MCVVDGFLVVDLDGTLYTGDAPIRRYAAEVARASGATELPELVAEYLGGGAGTVGAEDGWQAVQALAVHRFGVDEAVLNDAFLRTRWGLADGSVPVRVPDGFVELLAELRGRVWLVLATNSPRDGLVELLSRLRVVGVFDEVVFSTRKPEGLRSLLVRLLGAAGLTVEPWRAFSLGDHWRNDIEPAYSMGAATGYIDRFGRDDGPAHLRAPTLCGLLDGIWYWAADPGAFMRHHAQLV